MGTVQGLCANQSRACHTQDGRVTSSPDQTLSPRAHRPGRRLDGWLGHFRPALGLRTRHRRPGRIDRLGGRWRRHADAGVRSSRPWLAASPSWHDYSHARADFPRYDRLRSPTRFPEDPARKRSRRGSSCRRDRFGAPARSLITSSSSSRSTIGQASDNAAKPRALAVVFSHFLRRGITAA